MDKNLQNIEDIFKAALENDEEHLSPKVWNNIEQVLDKDSLISIKKKYSNLKKLAALLLFILICFSIYETSKKSNADLKRNGDVAGNDLASKIKNDKIVIEKKSNDFKNKIGTLKLFNTSKQNKITKRSNKNNNNFNTIINKNKNISASSFKVSAHLAFYNKHKMSLRTSGATEDELRINTNDKQITLRLQYSAQLNNISNKRTIKIPVDSIKFKNSLALNKILPSAKSENIKEKNKKLKDTKTSRFSITAFFSPDFASYHLEDDKDDNQPDNAITLKKKETHDLSSTVGALIDYSLSKRWSLQLGITFANTNITLDPKIIYAQVDNAGNVKYRINTSSGYGFVLPSFSNNPNVGDSLYVFTSTHNLQYIGIPLAIKYTTGKGKFNFTGSVGASVNYLVMGTIETLVESGTNNEAEVINNIKGLKKIYLSGLAGVGIEYSFSKKMALIFSPTIRFALNSINKNAPVKSYPNSFGLSTGIKIGL